MSAEFDDQPISITRHLMIVMVLLTAAALSLAGTPAVAQQAEPSLPAATQLDAANARFLSYYNDGLYGRAQVAAMQTVNLARELHGSESIEMGLALGNLATAQSTNGELVAARNNYNACIYLVEDHEGIVSPRLINPLMGLAATHNAMGNYSRGLDAYERALRINHVDLGLNNIEQMPIRDGLTESYVGLDDLDDANAQQEMQMRIAQQKFADDPDVLVAAMYKLAEWYRRSNQPEKEIQHMQKSVQTIRVAAGDDSAAEIKALRGLAEAYQRLDMQANAMRALKRAWSINEKSATPDLLLSADIEIQIGDFYNAFGSSKAAGNYYSSAWNTLEKVNADAKLFSSYFGEPINIWQIELPKVYPANTKTLETYLEDPEKFSQGYLTLQYDVDTVGRVTNVEIIEADPEDMLERKVTYLLTRFLYRPRFAAGSPVDTTKLQLRHDFSYRAPDTTQNTDVRKSDDSRGGKLVYPGATE